LVNGQSVNADQWPLYLRRSNPVAIRCAGLPGSYNGL